MVLSPPDSSLTLIQDYDTTDVNNNEDVEKRGEHYDNVGKAIEVMGAVAGSAGDLIDAFGTCAKSMKNMKKVAAALGGVVAVMQIVMLFMP